MPIKLIGIDLSNGEIATGTASLSGAARTASANGTTIAYRKAFNPRGRCGNVRFQESGPFGRSISRAFLCITLTWLRANFCHQLLLYRKSRHWP